MSGSYLKENEATSISTLILQDLSSSISQKEVEKTVNSNPAETKVPEVDDVAVEEIKEEEPPAPEPDQPTITSDKCQWWGPSRGIIFCIASAITGSGAKYMAEELFTKTDQDESDLDETLLLLTKCFLMFAISVAFIPFCTMQLKQPVCDAILPVDDDKSTQNFVNILIRTGSGLILMSLQYISLKFLPYRDTETVVFGYPLFVLGGTAIFLKEKLGLFQISMAMVAVGGVVLLNQPTFVAEQKSMSSEELVNYLFGIGVAAGAMIGACGVIISLRTLRNVHCTLINAIYGIAGTIIGFNLYLAFSKWLFLSLNMTCEAYGLLIGSGCLAVSSIYFETLSLKYETVAVFAIIRLTEIVLTSLIRMKWDGTVDYMRISGACIIVGCAILTGFQKFVDSLDEPNIWRRNLWFLLK